jgi:hypothetical protein
MLWYNSHSNYSYFERLLCKRQWVDGAKVRLANLLKKGEVLDHPRGGGLRMGWCYGKN